MFWEPGQGGLRPELSKRPRDYRRASAMASTSTSAPIAVAEYLRTHYRPDRDYVDGVVLERNVGENHHAYWQRAILLYLCAPGCILACRDMRLLTCALVPSARSAGPA